MTAFDKFIVYFLKDLNWLKERGEDESFIIKVKLMLITNIQAIVDEIEDTRLSELVEEEYKKFREEHQWSEEEIRERFLNCDECWGKILRKLKEEYEKRINRKF